MNTKTMFTIVGNAVVLGMFGTRVISLSTVSAASEQSYANWFERNDRAHDRQADGKESNGDTQSHDNVHKNFDNVCR
jgi:hypothetical protein